MRVKLVLLFMMTALSFAQTAEKYRRNATDLARQKF